jgi:hypothetical protein
MGIFSGLFRSRDMPQNRTASSNYTFYMGGSTSGKAVTERSAMQMTAVYSCVRILAEAIAGLPLNIYRYTDSWGKEKTIALHLDLFPRAYQNQKNIYPVVSQTPDIYPVLSPKAVINPVLSRTESAPIDLFP